MAIFLALAFQFRTAFKPLIVFSAIPFGAVGALVSLAIMRAPSGFRFDYLLVESTGLSEPLPVARPRLGRRTTLTFPLFPPPQKN